MRRATVKAIGMSRTKPTSKKTGKPTISPAHIMDQVTRRSPKRSIRVCAIRSEAPDSAIILPNIVPRPTTIAMCPRVLPIPVSKEETMLPSGIPVAAASASETIIRDRKALSLPTAMSRTSPITALAAASSRKTPWLSRRGTGFMRLRSIGGAESVHLFAGWNPRFYRTARH